MVGPEDLSGSKASTADFENPRFKEAIEEITSRVQCTKVRMGTHVVHPVKEDLNLAIKNNNKFIAYGIDAIFLSQGLNL
jgi:2-dehydro-3-deoxyglucarate aldolase